MDLPIVTRALTLEGESPIDVDKRLIRMSFSSSEPILRHVETKVYYERLSHDLEAIDTTRLSNRSVPFLDGHDWNKVGGKVVDYAVRSEKGHATVKLSRNAIGTEMLNDIVDGVRTEISFGYKVLGMKKTGERDGKDEYTVTKWMPYELSLVGVPADHTVGVGRAMDERYPVEIEGEERAEDDGDDHYSQYGDVEYADKKNHKYPVDTKAHAKAAWSYINMPKNAAKYSPEELKTIKGRIKAACKKHGVEMSEEMEMDPAGVTRESYVVKSESEIAMAENTPVSKVEVIAETPEKIREAELTRIREITAIGAKFGCVKEAEDFIKEGSTLASFSAFVLAEKANQTPAIRTADPYVGTTPKERQTYNLCKALLEGHEKLTGFEREMSQEISKQIGRSPSGMFIPEYALMPPQQTRADLSATGGASTGGALVPLIIDTTLVPFLRVKMVTGRMGATMFTGLTGNFALPRMTGAATAQWNTETGDITRSNQTFDQVVFQPQRLSASTAYSKWLLQQAVVDVQTVVRDDLLQIIAIGYDHAALYGTGASNQPVGIFSTTADTVWPSAYTKTSPSVTFGSGYPSWSKVVQFEGNVEANNIDLDNASCGYVTSPTVKSLWKTMAKADPRATNQFYPEFIWEAGTNGDGRVNGYKALSTKQISDDKVIFGRWSDLVIAQWGGIDMVTDPYTLASTFQIRIIINLMTDVDMRYSPSFCYSTDTGLMH